MKYKHLFFDLDKTLWDFETNSTETLHELFIKYDLEQKGVLSAKNFIKRYKEINDELWDEYRRDAIDKETLRIQRFSRTLLEFCVNDQELSFKMAADYTLYSPAKKNLLPYVHETLAYLNNKYHLHIITNGFEEIQHLKIKNTDLKKYFKKIITSEGAGYKKPNKSIFDYSLNAANALKEESMMIGDSLHIDLLGARNAGIDQVYFNPDEMEHQEKITYEISCLSELMEIL